MDTLNTDLHPEMTGEEEAFVERRLDGRELPDLLENVKVAIRQDNLMTERDHRYLAEVREITDFDTFQTGRRKALDEYNTCCDQVIDVLNDVEAIEDPDERMALLAPHAEEMFEWDARRRAYDMVYGEEENISEALIGELDTYIERATERKCAAGRFPPSEQASRAQSYRNTVIYPEQPSYEKESLYTFLRFIASADRETTNVIASRDKQRIRTHLDDRFDRINEETDGLLTTLYRQTARRHIPTLSRKLSTYSNYVGTAEAEADALEQQHETAMEKKAATMNEVADDLTSRERHRFYRLVEQIDGIHECIYEDVHRHANFRAVNDYFFREELGHTLYERGDLESPAFWKHPQQQLLDACTAYLEDTA